MGSQPVDAGAEGSIGFDDGPATIFDQADIPRVRPFKRPLHHSLMLAARGRTSVKIFALCASSIGHWQTVEPGSRFGCLETGRNPECGPRRSWLMKPA